MNFLSFLSLSAQLIEQNYPLSDPPYKAPQAWWIGGWRGTLGEKSPCTNENGAVQYFLTGWILKSYFVSLMTVRGKGTGQEM